jgi:glycosyltransferase involved in cell wall biosynthesis
MTTAAVGWIFRLLARVESLVKGNRSFWSSAIASSQLRYGGFGRYQAEGIDPQLELQLPPGGLRPGVYEIEIRSRFEPVQALQPRVYFDHGHGFNETEAHSLIVKGATARGLVAISQPAHRLRLDPISDAGACVLESIRIQRHGRFSLALAAMKYGEGIKQSDILRKVVTDPGGLFELLRAREDSHVGDDYRHWVSLYAKTPNRQRVASYLSELAKSGPLPKISVVMPAYNSNAEYLSQAIRSVTQQIYQNWELIVVDDCSPEPTVRTVAESAASEDPRVRYVRREQNGGIARATNDGLAKVQGDWVAFLDHDDELTSDALALLASEAVKHPDARIIYTDEDKTDEAGGLSEPYFKGEWNRELFYGQNYLNHLTAMKTDLVRSVGGCREDLDGSQDYDLVLRCIERVSDDQIRHLPFVCYHWRFTSSRANFSIVQADKSLAAARRALKEHFQRAGVTVDVVPAWPGSPYHRIVREVVSPAPFVSMIIPTRNQVHLLQACIESLRAKAGYSAYEIIIVDNDSDDPATLRYMEKGEASGLFQVLRVPGAFNYSAINNRAAKVARGDILAFINNDIEAISDNWLVEMLRPFAEKSVGAVGARLLYGDGRIQHAGVVVGVGGVAGHVGKLKAREDVGTFGALMLARDMSAVTAACMFMRRSVFEAVGGFDEVDLKVAFNDVDLCMKVRDAGWRIIWQPAAEMFHFESVSRGHDMVGEKLERFSREVHTMKSRWGAKLQTDPYYSPNLSLANERAELAFPPRRKRPWG